MDMEIEQGITPLIMEEDIWTLLFLHLMGKEEELQHPLMEEDSEEIREVS